MPTSKDPKLYELADQLGIKPKQLVVKCREAGLPVQNRLTRVPPDIERIIRGWFDASNETDSQTGSIDQP